MSISNSNFEKFSNFFKTTNYLKSLHFSLSLSLSLSKNFKKSRNFFKTTNYLKSLHFSLSLSLSLKILKNHATFFGLVPITRVEGESKTREVIMLAGGDKKSCSVGIDSSSRYYEGERLRVPDCLKEIIKQTKKPHGVVSGKAGRPADSFEYDAIVELEECRENKIYSKIFGGNEEAAKQCAHALTLLTDVKHEAFMLRSRLFWGNLYQVRKAK